jgi:hypothetical protein
MRCLQQDFIKGGTMNNNQRIKQKMRQFLSLLAVFLLVFTGNTFAKKKGAQVMIDRTDGQVVKGELLSVKQSSLLVMTTASNSGVTIEMNEIDKIGIKRKSKFGKGALLGGIIGVAGGAVLGGNAGSELERWEEGSIRSGAIKGGIVVGAACAVVGGIVSSISLKKYKTFQVKGKSPSELAMVMKRLEKKARFKNTK